VTFVSRAAAEDGVGRRLGLASRVVAVDDCRGVSKADLPNNTATPHIEIDPDTFTVRIDGEVVEADPATELPLAQRYLLF
jgi:urease subunit alpha